MKKKYFSSLILNFLVVMLVFQPYLQIKFPIFSYFDELIALLSIPVILVYFFKRHDGRITIKRDDLGIIVSLLGIFFIGIISNLLYSIQTTKYILGDILIFYKFFMLYFLSRILFKNVSINKNIIRVIIIFIFIGTIYDYLFSVNISSYLRYGFPSNYFIFGTPLGLVSISSFLLCCYLYENKKFDIYVILISIVILSSLRFKAFVFLTCFAILYCYIIKYNKKINFNKIIILGIIAFMIAYNQIEYYFFDSVDTTARGQLLVKSFSIMKDYFPVGTGFGTYGSYMSGLNYSSLYYTYGLSKIYGLSSTFMSYLCDSFWPMIFAQFGIFGAILFINCLKIFFNKIQNCFNNNNNYIYLSKLLAFLYLVISSMTESSFVNPICICFSIILGMGNDKDDENKH